MGTKNNPGAYDCYANADPDEPMFVLLGRDPMAGDLVRAWAQWRRGRGEEPAKIAEALACADSLDAWARKLGKTPLVRVACARCGRRATEYTIDGADSKLVCDEYPTCQPP